MRSHVIAAPPRRGRRPAVACRKWAWLGGVRMIRLSGAVEQYRREERAVSNSYDWYRRQAQRSGEVWIGGETIPARKASGAWFVSEDDLARCVAVRRQPGTTRPGRLAPAPPDLLR